MSKLLIGIGTGRNGSKSLAHFLNAQPRINFTHEECALAMDSVLCTFPKALSTLEGLQGDDYLYHGDIAPFWIYYMGELITLYPDVRIIWLRRKPIGSVIQSFFSYIRIAASQDQFPKYGWYPIGEEKFSHAAISRAVKKNEWLNEVCARMYPDNVLELRTDQLNIEECQYQVLDWLGIPVGEHVYGMPHLNKREERVSWATKNESEEINLKSFRTPGELRPTLEGLLDGTSEHTVTSG